MARTDVEDAFASIKKLLTTATPKAVEAARKAAADVYIRAAKQAAPGHTGQLKQSIKLVEGKPAGKPLMTDLKGQDRRYYVGPEKKKKGVDYGYFVEKGHRSYVRNIRGAGYRSTRINRASSIRPDGSGAHSVRGNPVTWEEWRKNGSLRNERLRPIVNVNGRQLKVGQGKGLEPNIYVEPQPWFEPAIKRVEKQALDAAETAFYNALKKEDK